MLTLLSNSPFVRVSGKIALAATGGTAPYTYSVPSNSGDGGSITAEGIFTAPSVAPLGRQVVRVTDDVGAIANYTIQIYSELQIICWIIQQYMNLSNDQVYIYNTKINVPKDDRIYIAVKQNSVKPFGSSRKLNSTGVSETLGTNVLANVNIDIMGIKPDVIYKSVEVLQALKSSRSLQTQHATSIKIGELPSSFTDLSGLEGPAIPYRFNISINVQYAIKKQVNIEYYDDFPEYELLKEQ